MLGIGLCLGLGFKINIFGFCQLTLTTRPLALALYVYCSPVNTTAVLSESFSYLQLICSEQKLIHDHNVVSPCFVFSRLNYLVEG